MEATMLYNFVILYIFSFFNVYLSLVAKSVISALSIPHIVLLTNGQVMKYNGGPMRSFTKVLAVVFLPHVIVSLATHYSS